MSKFTLPLNSIIKKGRYIEDSSISKDSKTRIFKIYRYSQEGQENPRVDTFKVNLDLCGPKILDVLMYIKSELDPKFSFRRSCREGICGSCSMNINGRNTLACIAPLSNYSSGVIKIFPLPHMPVIKDLVVDLTTFYNHYKEVKPWLQADNSQLNNKERKQSIADKAKIDGYHECILCACCSTSCPSFWWNGDKYLGPAALLQAYRWVSDTRDENKKERLREIADNYKLYSAILS